MQEGSIVDATFIAAPPSTKTRTKARDPGMHQTQKARRRLGDGVSCRAETGKALIEAGLHPATGGTGLTACSGDTLFVLESGYDPSNGMSEPGGRLFGRQSYVGQENELGRITLGRQFSPNFVAIDPFDATGSADRSVGLLSRKAGGVRPAYEVRFDDMVKYRSPKIAGFELDGGYSWGEQPGETSVRPEGHQPAGLPTCHAPSRRLEPTDQSKTRRA
jgi:hypothetical protein